jgi:serine kinase of HPr protein (carbohydrate metabolism regulator)
VAGRDAADGGTLRLHACGIVLDGRALAFVAPKQRGKSSLSIAFVADGARILADDSVVIDPRNSLSARAGEDTGMKLSRAVEELYDGNLGVGGPAIVEDIADAYVQLGPVPVETIYLISHRPPEPDGMAVSRHRVGRVAAIATLVRHCKPPVYRRPASLVRVSTLAIRIAVRASIYELRIVRDLPRLPEVVRQLREWHVEVMSGATSPLPPPAGASD